MKSLSIVVPIFKDSYLAKPFCAAAAQLTPHLAAMGILQMEVIFVSDGIESDVPTLMEVCDEFEFAKLISLTRNFGQHIAITCGLNHASGDFICYTDVDMEDPVDQIPVLIEEVVRAGADICVGIRGRKKVSWIRRQTSRLFHMILTKLTKLEVPPNGSTMRIMTRRYLGAYNQINERERYLPGIEAWLGFKTVYKEISQQPRALGESSYSFKRKLRLAVSAILSFSDLPLRIVIRIGFAISALSFLMGAYLIVNKVFFTSYQPGFTTTTTLIMFFGGFQVFVTGITGLYVGRILREVQNRPLYVIREKFKVGD